jgi:xylulokinase
MLMYGTTMFMIEVLKEPLSHPGLWGTTGILPKTHNLAAGMATSGALTGWLKKISGDMPYEDLTREAAGVPPGSDALVVLPYFAGERTPLFDPRARGLISGLTLSHGRGHLYRAMLEATAYGVRHIFEFMRDAGGGGERLVAVGGGTKGGLWTQIVSDVTGRPQNLPEQTIGASYGDALLAARAVGLAEPDADWSTISETVEPEAENREIYDELYGIYRDLYPATREASHALADLQKGGGSVVT